MTASFLIPTLLSNIQQQQNQPQNIRVDLNEERSGLELTDPAKTILLATFAARGNKILY